MSPHAERVEAALADLARVVVRLREKVAALPPMPVRRPMTGAERSARWYQKRARDRARKEAA